MTADERSFIAAIIADKANDTPRLAYADWLEERATTERCPACRGDTRHRLKVSDKPERYVLNMVPGTCSACSGSGRVPDGRAARAEFIRVQVELARLEEPNIPFSGRCPHCTWHQTPCRYHALRRRERELWNLACDQQWFDVGIPSGTSHYVRGGPLQITWTHNYRMDEWEIDLHAERGFIGKIALSWNCWRQHADAITRAQPIERVRLTTWPRWEMEDCTIHYGDMALPFIQTRWPGITFELPPEPTAPTGLSCEPTAPDYISLTWTDHP